MRMNRIFEKEKIKTIALATGSIILIIIFIIIGIYYLNMHHTISNEMIEKFKEFISEVNRIP